jgi:large subunit ribosomal protein L1
MVKVSKRIKKSYEAVDRKATYSLEEGIAAIKDFPKVNFDETVELHFVLNINPKSSDQIVRGTVVLPHGTGKKIRVAAFCKGESESVAKEAGADIVGAEDLVEKISKGFLDFDVVVASPDMMKVISKLGKILGPRGLMPSPKAGTVTQDIAKAVQEVKAGKIEFKSDKQAGIHVAVGKRSFSQEQLLENARCLIDALNHAKPASVKINLIKKASLATSMGLGLRIAL